MRALLACLLGTLGLFGAAPGAAIELAPGDVLGVLAEESIVRIDPSGASEAFFTATGAGLASLYGVAVERSGAVLVLAVAGGGTRLERVDPATGAHALVAALPAFGLPFSAAFDRTGAAALFFVDFGGHVYRVNLATGAVVTLATLPSDGSASFALATAPDGALYVSDDAQDRVLRLDPATGATTVVAESTELGGFYRAHGIDVDRDGAILGTRYDPPAILRIDPATGAQQVVAEDGLLAAPVELEIDRDGTVLVANLWDGDVVRVDLATGAQTKRDTPYLLTGLAMVPYPECSNGRDDDGRTGIDFDGGAAANGGVALDVPDPQCTSPWARERASCGLGAELAPLCALVARRLRGRRPASARPASSARCRA